MKAIKDKFLFLVRHGERMDLLENIDLNLLKLGKYDTELTDLGHSQAFKVGEKIKEFIKENYIEPKNTAIISSPFARTIQTSAKLIKGLGVDRPIIVENGLSEHLNPKWYPIPPEHFLVCYKDKDSKESKCFLEFIDNQEVVYSDITSLPNHPETHDECFKRLSETYELIIPHYMKTNDVMVIVTHYLALDYFLKLYHDKESKIPLEYCLTYCFRYDGEKLNKYELVSKVFP
jgi:broad specificity phosphatase PhoE